MSVFNRYLARNRRKAPVRWLNRWSIGLHNAIENVDSSLVMMAPKIGPHATAIRARVAELLGIEPGAVGIKAKTPEGLGTDHAAQCHAVVLLMKHGS